MLKRERCHSQINQFLTKKGEKYNPNDCTGALHWAAFCSIINNRFIISLQKHKTLHYIIVHMDLCLNREQLATFKLCLIHLKTKRSQMFGFQKNKTEEFTIIQDFQFNSVFLSSTFYNGQSLKAASQK